MSNKKKIEQEIFDLVYGDRDDLILEHKDKPDFWVKNMAQERFGVEVTELYNNESAARLRNIPSYTKELLEKKEYKHKDDIKNLKVDIIKIENTTRETIETTAIIQEHPTLAEYLDNFKKRLNNKNKSLRNYNKELLHHNLIIHDTSSMFTTLKHDQFYNCFYQPAIIKEIVKSEFREIYLIARIGKRDLFFPLKTILFLSRVFFYHEVLRISKKKIDNSEAYYICFCEFLSHQGFKKVQLVKIKNEYQVIYGNTGFLLKDHSTVILKDYNDYKTPLGISAPNIGFIDETITKTIQNVECNFGFETEMGKEIQHTTSRYKT